MGVNTFFFLFIYLFIIHYISFKCFFKVVPKSLLGNPGPGSYQVGSTLTAEGKYTLSKIRNPPVHSFNPPHNSSAFSKGFINAFDLLLFLLKIQEILDQDTIL